MKEAYLRAGTTVGMERYASVKLCNLCSVSNLRFNLCVLTKTVLVAVLCSMPPNRCPVFVREGGVVLSLLAIAMAQVTNHFCNSSVCFHGSSLNNHPSLEE